MTSRPFGAVLSQFHRTASHWQSAALAELWRCPQCASVIEFSDRGVELNLERLRGDGFGRYVDWLGLGDLISIGEVRTPLLTLDDGLIVKNEGLQPTGSFKDRGAAALISWLALRAVARIVVDSSGNAGAAIAAY